MKCFFLAILMLSLSGVAQSSQTLTPLPGQVPAPDFTLSDTEGTLHRLSDYKGKTVIINFWATWCPPCREEIPSMNRAWRALQKENVVLLAINVGEDEDTIFQFTANYPVEFPLLMDLDSTIIGEWPVRGLPTTFVVDPQGRLAYRAIGGREWDEAELLQQLKALRK